MKSKLCFFLFLMSACAASSFPAFAAWQDSWLTGQSGYERAQTQKPFLIYFYAKWCPYCKSFEKKTLDSPEFKSAFSSISKVHVDVEKYRALAQEFEIDSFPRVFIFYSKDRVQEIPAHPNPKQFIEDARRTGLRVS